MQDNQSSYGSPAPPPSSHRPWALQTVHHLGSASYESTRISLDTGTPQSLAFLALRLHDYATKGQLILISMHSPPTVSASSERFGHTPSIAFRHLPPNSARLGYATEGALFISAQLSTDAVRALRKVRVLIMTVEASAQARMET